MKISSLLLAIYICLLTVQPVAARVYDSLNQQSETHACCKHKTSPDNKRNMNNCCDNGVCNPFGMCTCCFVFNPVQTILEFKNSVYAKTFTSEPENNLVSFFTSDCFHPPEISSTFKTRINFS